MTTTRTSDSRAVCCGEHYPGQAGAPLVLACQLCRRSPTYWHPEHRDTGPEEVRHEPTSKP